MEKQKKVRFNEKEIEQKKEEKPKEVTKKK